MTAPALVALAHGSRDPRSAQTIKALVDEVRSMRPDLRIEPAFLELAKPSFATVVDRLVKAGYDEIVVVPLLLTEAYHAKVDVPAAIAAATERHVNLARLWGSKHRLPTVAAYASAAPPATGEAVRQFRAEGRRHIAVGSLFLAPGTLPDRAAELAVEAGAVAVSEPLGADPEVARTILARYAVGAVELVPV
jgi:sirohydrochlorin ferrochelatase